MRDERQGSVVEALAICGDIFLACAAARVPMSEHNMWIREDPEWLEETQAATNDGKVHKEKVEKMRTVVEKHDEAMVVLQKRAEIFKEMHRRQSAIQVQLL